MISVGATHRPPIGGGSFTSRFRLEGRTLEGEDAAIGVRIVTPDHFQTMSVPVLRGRGIGDQDRAGGLPTVVINETAAKRFVPGEDPIGRRLLDFAYDPIEDAAEAFTVAGVAVTLGVTALFATAVPAWRAAAVDPLVALRTD